MKNLITRFSEFCKNLKRAFLMAKADTAPVRIVEMQSQPDTNQVIFVVQVTNKNIFLRYTANELIGDQRVAKILSKEDYALVESKKSGARTNDKNHPFKISAFEFHADAEEYVYTIRFDQGGKTLVRDFTLEELMNHPMVLSQLDSTDHDLIKPHQERIKSLK